MADTTTSLGFVKPEIGASENTWGTKINANMDAINTLIVALQAAVANTEALVQPGTIEWVARTTAPPGRLIANGAAVSRTTYAALFAAIGTTYGAGNGSTTFNLPDLRGVVARGLDSGRGFDTGRTIGSYQADQFQDHSHSNSIVAGGAHTHTLTQSPHSHVASDSGHTHPGGDYGHQHNYSDYGPNNPAVPDTGQPVDQSGPLRFRDHTRASALGYSNIWVGAGAASISVGANTISISVDSSGSHTHTMTNGVAADGLRGTETRMKNIALLAVIKF